MPNLRDQPDDHYRWADRAARYGMGALMPKGRRSPAMPNATAPEVIEVVLAEAIARPTLGARRLLEHLEERQVVLSASGVQKLLNRHRLGRRGQRVAALAQITAVDSGLVTQPARWRSASAFSGDRSRSRRLASARMVGGPPRSSS